MSELFIPFVFRYMYIDSHTHLQFPDYKNDREEVIGRIKEKNIRCINVGTDKPTSEEAIKLAHKYGDFMYATAGLHPSDLERGVFDYSYYKKLCSDDKVVAVGECGLDFFRIGKNDKSIKNKQVEVFKKQIALSKETNKPLMIHTRPSPGLFDAYKQTFDILKRSKHTDFVMHFFAGNVGNAKNFLELGGYFTFGGVITFTSDYNKVVKYIPLDRMLLETDAPYVSPAPYRGKRNEPSFVIEIYKKISELKNVSMKKLKETVLENNKRAFKTSF